jgi:hypothetical protein
MDIKILELLSSFMTPIVVLVLGLMLNKTIEKGKLSLLKNKEWQVKWADLFFNEAILFNNLVSESVSLLNELQNLSEENVNEINQIIRKLNIEKYPMLETTEWNIQNFIQLSNKDNAKELLSIQSEIFKEISSINNSGILDFESIRKKQHDYNKLARVIHNEIMNNNS